MREQNWTAKDLWNLGDKIKEAHIVFARDVKTGVDHLVFGFDSLHEIMLTKGTRKMNKLTIDCDFDTDDLEAIIAACTVVKGRHDYQRRLNED